MTIKTANGICLSQKPADLFQEFLVNIEDDCEKTRSKKTKIFPSNKYKVGLNSLVNRTAMILQNKNLDLNITEKISKTKLKQLLL